MNQASQIKTLPWATKYGSGSSRRHKEADFPRAELLFAPPPTPRIGEEQSFGAAGSCGAATTEGCQRVAGGRNAVETSGFRTEMDCTQKGCQKGITGDRSMSPAVDCELRIVRNGRGNVGIAPLLGASCMGAVTGGFAVLNLRLLSVNPPGSIAAAPREHRQTCVAGSNLVGCQGRFPATRFRCGALWRMRFTGTQVRGYVRTSRSPIGALT
jgi:hypothetical protein